jgi:putative transposase
LVERRGRTRRRAQGIALSLGQRPTELWCADYEGKFVTAHASRYLLTCEALSSTREDLAFTVFERLFKEPVCRPTSAVTTASLSLPPMLYST